MEESKVTKIRKSLFLKKSLSGYEKMLKSMQEKKKMHGMAVTEMETAIMTMMYPYVRQSMTLKKYSSMTITG